MRVLLLSILFITLAFSGLGWMKYTVKSPEKLIVGTWKEKAWKYERVGTPGDLKNKDTVSQAVKDQLGKHLVIHSAERWEFKPGGVLTLTGNNSEKKVKWKLKGRGHILELEYADHIIEHYNITEITENTLVLNFDSDIQVKGIAKLIFQK